MKKIFENKRGITLISLVVTIIILIILAGVSIHLVLGDNGIIEKAKLAKASTANAQIQEETALKDYENEIENAAILSSRAGGNPDYGYFYIENETGKATNTRVQFNKIEGNLNFDETNKTISLKANKHYVIHFSTRLFDPSDYGDFVFYNETENTSIKSIHWASGNVWLYHDLQLIYTPTSDINVSIKATSTGDIQYLEAASLTIYEI